MLERMQQSTHIYLLRPTLTNIMTLKDNLSPFILGLDQIIRIRDQIIRIQDQIIRVRDQIIRIRTVSQMLARNWTSTVRSIAGNLLGDMMVQCMVMSISRSQHDYAFEIMGGNEAEDNAFPWYLVLSLLEGVEAIAKLSLPTVQRLSSPCSSFVVCCSSSRLVTCPLISTI